MGIGEEDPGTVVLRLSKSFTLLSRVGTVGPYLLPTFRVRSPVPILKIFVLLKGIQVCERGCLINCSNQEIRDR